MRLLQNRVGILLNKSSDFSTRIHMPQSASLKRARKPVRTAKQERSRATVEVIVEAATRILSDHGWAGLNTNAIAKRAGVSVGSVYEYFPNKHAIVDIALDRHLLQGEDLVRQGVERVASLKSTNDVVDLLVAGFVRLHSDDPNLHRALSSDVPLTTEQKARVADLRAKIIELTTLALSKFVKESATKATLLVDTADALTHKWLIDEAGAPVSAEKLTQELGKMLRLYVTADD